MDIRIIKTDAANADILPVLSAHIAAMDNDPDTPKEARHRFDIKDFSKKGVVFWVAYVEGRVVGVIGLKIHNDVEKYGEIKSMHVLREWRSKGIAEALLAALEAGMVAQNITVLRFETGRSRAFIAARKFYEKSGFQPCEAFGCYENHPASLFMEKRLL